jgi:hypothetical protein
MASRTLPSTVLRSRLSAGWLCLALWPTTAALALGFEDLALEGQIKFFSARPDPQAYRYESRVRISEDSLSSGLVGLSTCHQALDPNARIVIAFNPERVRHIAITSTQGVGQAEVVGHRVELSDVQRGGSICIDLVSRALERTSAQGWRLHAGPLMRRYLDGYLPMEASLSFQWPDGLLRLSRTQPAAQPGVQVTASRDGARMNLVFAGRLSATLDLEAVPR